MAPNLDRTGPEPIYLQLEEWMRHQIASGAWPGRFKLPAEVDLASELGISRGTVRRALEDLATEGLLTRTHGLGTFVSPRVVEQPLADRLVTFSEALIFQGIPFETRVIDKAVIPAKGHVAAMLGLPTNTRTFFLRRVRLVAGDPLILLDNYVVYDRCPGVERLDFTRLRLFEVLEERYGLRLENGRRNFQAQAADRETALRLNMKPGEPVMYIEQLAYLDDGTPIEFSDIWLSGDRFRLTAAVKRTDIPRVGLSMSLLPNGQDGTP